MSLDKVTIGKNAIELLTTGMYDNPLVIYREYVQNSADAISSAIDSGVLSNQKDGMINIVIKSAEQRIEIHDNATGVKGQDAWEVLTSVAASRKDREKHLGFRGIGRLAGLAYCEKLAFETSFQGENTKTVLEWDGIKLRSIISDHDDQRTAEEVISSITTFRNNLPEQSGEHYFRVILKNVTNQELLRVDEVERYLRMVAPVDFMPRFFLRSQINDRLKELGVRLREYQLYVNNDEVFKPYRNRIYKRDSRSEKAVDDIHTVEFEEIKDGNTLLGVAWYSLTEKMTLIPVYNEPVGIRLRKGNIQIGNRSTCKRFFTEERFQNYFVGEVHVVSPELLPNGQRDYFDECAALRVFESEMRRLGSKLKKLCRDTSEFRSAVQSIENLKKSTEEYAENQKQGLFFSPSHEKDAKNKIESQKNEAFKAEAKIRKIKEKARQDTSLSTILKRHEEKQKQSVEINELSVAEKKKKRYRSANITSLNRKEQKLIGEVYEVVRVVLTPDLAENLICKIEEHFKPGNSSNGKN